MHLCVTVQRVCVTYEFLDHFYEIKFKEVPFDFYIFLSHTFGIYSFGENKQINKFIKKSYIF